MRPAFNGLTDVILLRAEPSETGSGNVRVLLCTLPGPRARMSGPLSKKHASGRALSVNIFLWFRLSHPAQQA